MPRAYPHSHLSHGVLVGFSVKQRPDEKIYYAYFRDRTGRRLMRDTGQTAVLRAVEAAKAIIDKDYAPPPVKPENAAWDDVTERLRKRLLATGERPTTVRYYLSLLRAVRSVFKATDGPADITPGMATAWRDHMMTTPKKNGKSRSPHYVKNSINGLSAIWNKWFLQELKIVPGDPWKDVEVIADKLPVRSATDEQASDFLAWLDERFSGWPVPRLFLELKSHSGCRLYDICSLLSSQLQDGRIVFPADTAKGRKERKVPLPLDLYAALEGIKGKTYLWENYPAGLKEALKKKGWPTHRLSLEFSPKRMAEWVQQWFVDHRADQPEEPRLTSHMFRKRAFTRAWQAKIEPRRAAIAIGCNVDTMMKHYVGLDEQEVTDEVFAALSSPPAQQTPNQPGERAAAGSGSESEGVGESAGERPNNPTVAKSQEK